jgi:hypothetical protein
VAEAVCCSWGTHLTVVPCSWRATPTAGLRRRRRSSQFAQQMRSNSALRNRMNHHSPTLLRSCYGLLREVWWWALWRGSLDGMQGVRGSDPSVPHGRIYLSS